MTTVLDCWEHYAAHHLSLTCAPETNGRYWGRLQWFGSKDAECLSPMEVDAYIAMRGVMPATINRELSLLRAALHHGEKHGLIGRTPHIKRVPGAVPKLRALSIEEAKQIVVAADKGNWREQVYVRLALGTGARPDATVKLKWSQVHKNHGSIDFRAQGALAHRMKRRAIVPINDMVKEALKIAGQHRDGEYVIHWGGKPLASPRPLMARIAARAGIKNCSPHVLRHTVASILLSQEVDLLKVSRLLGHASTIITEQVYFQHPPSCLTFFLLHEKTTDLLDF